ncbi:MAG: Vps5 C terminal like-domain-containing protein [Piptocephalis tieghemiana]|nr:MAG: Vps5 C terminal like-domain-containing protein [Piptocephalis tieghemiana]
MASPPPVPIVIVRIQGVDRSKHAPNYRLDFHTNLPNYASETYKGVQREYAEFSRLSQILEASHIGRLIPPLPQGSTSHTEESEDDRLTCMALEKWLSLVANHPIVGLDDQIRAFIEAKVMYAPPPPKNLIKSSSTWTLSGLKEKIAGGPSPLPVTTDEDAYFATAKHTAGALEGQCTGAEKGSSKLVKARLGLALAQSEFAANLSQQGEAEEDASLSDGLIKLGKTLNVIAEVNDSQSIEDLALFGDHLTQQASMAKKAKDTLALREQLTQNLRTATQTTEKRRANLDRLRSGTRPERVPGAIAELEEAQSTTALREDLPFYSRTCAREMRRGFREYAMAQLQREWAKLRALG